MLEEITMEMGSFVLVMVVIPVLLFVIGYFGTLLLDRLLNERGKEHEGQFCPFGSARRTDR